MGNENEKLSESGLWTTVSIPKILFARIKEAIKYLGYPNVAEYVREASREKLALDEHKVREIKSIRDKIA